MRPLTTPFRLGIKKVVENNAKGMRERASYPSPWPFHQYCCERLLFIDDSVNEYAFIRVIPDSRKVRYEFVTEIVNGSSHHSRQKECGEHLLDALPGVKEAIETLAPSMQMSPVFFNEERRNRSDLTQVHLPLASGHGRPPIGCIAITKDTPDGFTPYEIAVLEVFSKFQALSLDGHEAPRFQHAPPASCVISYSEWIVLFHTAKQVKQQKLASMLNISERSVRQLLSDARQKLGLTDRDKDHIIQSLRDHSLPTDLNTALMFYGELDIDH